jgi:SAM-dependent methyltransferase
MTESCKICGNRTAPFLRDLFDDRHGYPGKFDIYRCEECGFCQTLPEIPEDKIGEVYTRYYPRKNLVNIEDIKRQSINLLPERRRWWMGVNNTAHYHIKAGTRVLDIGCGDCTSIREIKALGAEGYGIEPDENIRPIVDALGLNVHIGLLNEVPYPDKFFDFITMSQVLEHIHNPIELLKSLRRILKDGGQVIIGVPNVDSRLRKKYGIRWLNWHVPYHINHFSRRSLYILAKNSGYSVRKALTITPNLWVILQHKMLKFPVGEGVRVPFLNGEPEYPEPITPPQEPTPILPPRPGRLRRLAARLKARLEARTTPYYDRWRDLSQLALLRAIDLAGGGESYLVFLEKKKG